MNTFKVSGHREVAGKKPGQVVTEKDLGSANVDALIQAGLISVQVTSSKDIPVSNPVEEEQE